MLCDRGCNSLTPLNLIITTSFTKVGLFVTSATFAQQSFGYDGYGSRYLPVDGFCNRPSERLLSILSCCASEDAIILLYTDHLPPLPPLKSERNVTHCSRNIEWGKKKKRKKRLAKR